MLLLRLYPVSYTHLDVYKRQEHDLVPGFQMHFDGTHLLGDILARALYQPLAQVGGELCPVSYTHLNGFNGDYHNTLPYDLFTAILSDSRAETLLKAGQYAMLRHYIPVSYTHLDVYKRQIPDH